MIYFYFMIQLCRAAEATLTDYQRYVKRDHPLSITAEATSELNKSWPTKDFRELCSLCSFTAFQLCYVSPLKSRSLYSAIIFISNFVLALPWWSSFYHHDKCLSPDGKCSHITRRRPLCAILSSIMQHPPLTFPPPAHACPIIENTHFF